MKKNGFTLIELIIVLAIMVIILGCITSMFITGNKVFAESDIKSTFQIQGNDFQEKMSDIGLQAEGIAEVLDSGSGENNSKKNITEEEYSNLVSSDGWVDISSITIKSYFDESGYINDNEIYPYKLSTIKYNKTAEIISMSTKVVDKSKSEKSEIITSEKENTIAKNVKEFKIKNIDTSNGNNKFKNAKSIETKMVCGKKVF